ncbi:putative FMN-dependent luciferase-like monooxygenase [Sinirhodobacter populi]|uniref:Putative FMN-dependent luciferase-like monooxygenase n=1 Tax=Paenirhodobacter populi TaxID=2306993 RepID=A0A443K3P7_9RHOB|nr:putative FMN-dependent luciferase-like monooxygenase [Sinirhodobacter populi]RWR27362.1 putative FMN-dependent luciferase-like monooxygenase [Sinirhodobacter populi]
MATRQIGFFTRLLDDVPAAERYRLALAQIRAAEAAGFHTAWVAQHHFHGDEGGLPSPFPFLSYVAAQTSAIRLATGVVTLTMEDPIRVAEDAVVTDILSGGRLEVGFGSGGTAQSYTAFGQNYDDRHRVFAQNLGVIKAAWSGAELPGGNRLWPKAGGLADRSWQATFSTGGAARAGRDGDGLLLSRTQPRPKDRPDATLAEIQLPVVEAYLAALPTGRAPRILASRSVFVADDREEARRFARIGLSRQAAKFRESGHTIDETSLDTLIRTFDVHVGTPEEVIRSLSQDQTLEHATEIAIQVHSVDPPHAHILRSIELFAAEVAPALGWGNRGAGTGPQRAALETIR